MSLLWLEPFILSKTESFVLTFQSVNIVIYLNMISIICFVLYSLIYKMDTNMQKPPNSLIIWKMFGECLISTHLLILFLCFSIENNKTKISFTKYIIWLISLLSPVGLYITYFFAACIAHNLYCTFHNYKNDFDMRLQKYKIYAMTGGIFLLFISLIITKQYTPTSTIKCSLSYFPNWFSVILYFLGGLGMIYIIIKTIFVLKKKGSFLKFMFKNTQNEEDNFQHKIVALFISRHLMFCYAFLGCFGPNNFVIIYQAFVKTKICTNCNMYSFMVYLVSLSCTIDFCIKLTEPYMKKYLRLLFLAFFRKKDDIQQTGEDYNVLYLDSDSDDEENDKNYNQNSQRLISKTDTYKQNKDNNENKNETSIKPKTLIEMENLNINQNINQNQINNNSIKEEDSKENSTDFIKKCRTNINFQKAKHRKSMMISKKNEIDEMSLKLNSMANTVEIVTREMQINDFYKSLLSIWLTSHHDDIYDNDEFLIKNEHSYLPWKDEHYTEKSPLLHYTNKTVFDIFGPIEEIKDDFYFNVKIRKYAPKIFYALRKIDNISNKDYLNSLSPKDNLKIIKESFASGGRSANPIIFTYDKKFLLKTISKAEKNTLLDMLPEFHRRMRDKKSLLCRIYGVYRIEVVGKQVMHLLVMRNMNELPSKTKYCCFDLKGSTVARTSLNKKDKEEIINGFKEQVIKNYKKTVLKDLDFDLLDFYFDFTKEECDLIQNSLCEDSEFLKGNNLIDYSLLCTIHEFNQQDYDQVSPGQRYRIVKTKDGKFLYNLSIIDFLTPYGLTKKFELGIKTAGAKLSENGDTNFSVLDAVGYSRRFVRYLNKKFKWY